MPIMLETEGRIWAIRSEVLYSLAKLSTIEIKGRVFTDEELAVIRAATEESRALRLSEAREGGAVATIPLKGVLTPQVSLFAMLFGGGSSLNRFRSDLKSAAANPDVSHIVMDIDSPGGLVDQIPETAAEIRQAKTQKPVTAVANTLAASAAYWLGSQASEFVVTPSGEAGSIGVYSIHKDLSGMHEKMGVVPTIIKAGKRKIEGNPFESLTDEAQQGIQEAVNDYYSLFTRDVARGRGVSTADVREGYGEGRTLTARRAVQAGLVDRVDTLEGTIARAAKGEVPASKAALDDVEDEELEDIPDPEGDDEDEEGADAYSPEERNRVLETLAALGMNK
jgi:capsid assembly protease